MSDVVDEVVAEDEENTEEIVTTWLQIGQNILGFDSLVAVLGINPAEGDGLQLESLPENVGDRLSVLTTIIYDLSGSYNEDGMRQWFKRPREALFGATPLDVLSAIKWNEYSVERVKQLASSLH